MTIRLAGSVQPSARPARARRTLSRPLVIGSAGGSIGIGALVVAAALAVPGSVAPVALWLAGFALLGVGLSIPDGGRHAWLSVLAGVMLTCVVAGTATAIGLLVGLVSSSMAGTSPLVMGLEVGVTLMIMAAPPVAVGLLLGHIITGLRAAASQRLNRAAGAGGGSHAAPWEAPVVVDTVARPTAQRLGPDDVPMVGVILSAIMAVVVGAFTEAPILALVVIGLGSLAAGATATAMGGRLPSRFALLLPTLSLPVALLAITLVDPDRDTWTTPTETMASVILLLAFTGLPLLAGCGLAAGARRIFGSHGERTEPEAGALGPRVNTLSVHRGVAGSPTAPSHEPLSRELVRAIADGATTLIRHYDNTAKGNAQLSAETELLGDRGYALRSVDRTPGRHGLGWKIALVGGFAIDMLALLTGRAQYSNATEFVAKRIDGSIVATFDRL